MDMELRELREFITRALLDIITGIEDTQQQSSIDKIIPDIAGGDQKARPEISDIQSIEFEVSIKVDKQTSGEGKLDVGVIPVLGEGLNMV